VRVSIGIPFHNNEQTLVSAIRSVFAQTFQDWELILVNDGSSDKSLEIAQAIDDPRVRVTSYPLNTGLSIRLNQITAMARGEYIARMDADDLMHPERLARQVKYLDANSAVDLVGTGTYTINFANHPVGTRGLAPPDTNPQAILRRGLMIHPTVIGRTRWFHRNPYSELPVYKRTQDRELWSRSCQHSIFASLQEPLYFYREGNGDRSRVVTHLRNYLQSCHAERRVIATYGP
jgi:glycosyltransferase involved in cell wall biosynthesis